MAENNVPYWRVSIREEYDDLVLNVDKVKEERFFEGETWDKIFIDEGRLYISIITQTEGNVDDYSEILIQKLPEVLDEYLVVKKEKIKEDIDYLVRLKSMKYSKLLMSVNRTKVLGDLTNEINNKKSD